MISRVAYSQIVNRRPGAAEHVAAGAGILAAALVYAVTRYWPRAKSYHESATIGAAIAAIQVIIQTYAPKIGWVICDVRPEQYRTAQLPASAQVSGDGLDALLAENPELEAVEVGEEDIDESDLGIFD